MHIFVHHCTFCASLHVKISPRKGEFGGGDVAAGDTSSHIHLLNFLKNLKNINYRSKKSHRSFWLSDLHGFLPNEFMTPCITEIFIQLKTIYHKAMYNPLIIYRVYNLRG